MQEQPPLSPSQESNTSPQLTVEERVYGLSYFWSEVAYNFSNWDGIPNLDWNSAYRDFLSRVIDSKNDFEYYREMQRFVPFLRMDIQMYIFPRNYLMNIWEYFH